MQSPRLAAERAESQVRVCCAQRLARRIPFRASAPSAPARGVRARLARRHPPLPPPPSQVTEYYEVFAFHDADRDGFLSVGQFSAAVRSLGYAPTAGQLLAMHRTVDRAYPMGLTFSDFIKVMGMVVEPKVMRAALAAPAIIAGLAAFEELCAYRPPLPARRPRPAHPPRAPPPRSPHPPLPPPGRRRLTGMLTVHDLVSFLRAPGPAELSEEDIDRFLRFVGLGDAAPTEEIDYKVIVATLIAAARSAKA